MELQDLRAGDFKRVFKSIQRDFAAGEYPPYFVLHPQVAKGIQSCVLLMDDGVETGYAVSAAGGDYVLVSYLAVHPQFRGRGCGTALLELLKERYAQKKGMIAEVELPEAARTPEERQARLARIRYYEKSGFRMVPDIEYSIWDVPMHLMVLPLQESAERIFSEIGRIMYDIYLTLMGKHYIHKMKIRETK